MVRFSDFDESASMVKPIDVTKHSMEAMHLVRNNPKEKKRKDKLLSFVLASCIIGGSHMTPRARHARAQILNLTASGTMTFKVDVFLVFFP